MIMSAKKVVQMRLKFQIWNPKEPEKGSWDLDGRKTMRKIFLR